jgi:hypothetical protein
MIRSNWLVAVVVICLTVAGTLLIPHGQVVSADSKPAPEPPVGRYQVFKAQNLEDDCLLDTATGKVWRLKSESKLRGEWVLAVEGPK